MIVTPSSAMSCLYFFKYAKGLRLNKLSDKNILVRRLIFISVNPIFLKTFGQVLFQLDSINV